MMKSDTGFPLIYPLKKRHQLSTNTQKMIPMTETDMGKRPLSWSVGRRYPMVLLSEGERRLEEEGERRWFYCQRGGGLWAMPTPSIFVIVAKSLVPSPLIFQGADGTNDRERR